MSDSGKEKAEDSTSQTSFIVKYKSYEKLPNKSDSLPIVINIYPSGSYSQKLPRLNGYIQADHAFNTVSKEVVTPVIENSDSQVINIQENLSTTATLDDSLLEKVERKKSSSFVRKLFCFEFDEKKEGDSMESRKQIIDKPNKVSTTKQSDLERRRLEAELKAAEEIAKLRQSIIEKRLALELATLDDPPDHSKSLLLRRPSLQAELRALEETAMRKQSLLEAKLGQEFETMDYQRHRPPPPPIPPPPIPPPPNPPPPIFVPPSPPPTPCTRQYSPVPPKVGTFRTDSTCSVLNSIRSLGILDKKLNLDRKFSGDFAVKTPTHTATTHAATTHAATTAHTYPPQYVDPRARIQDGYYGQMPDSQYQNHKRTGRAYAAWKSAIAKIKNKIRNRPPDGWTGE